ncbi:MAG: HTH domain-containing protein [Polyangiaceae bacterium]
MKRKSRLFALAEHLRGRRSGVTAKELADRFGVTERTMYRDLDALREADLPVTAERGPGGGFALDRAYTLPPVNFTPREAALLLALGRFAREMRVVPFVDTLASALDKVRGALSKSAQRELTTHLDTLSFVGVPASDIPKEVRRGVEEAWFERQPLVLHYRGADGVRTTRRVRIESVVMDRQFTFLNCRDLDKDDARQFRLDRIEGTSRDSGPSRVGAAPA